MAIELTKEEELQAAYEAGTLIGKGCIGVARGLKTAGWLIGKGGMLTALGLTVTANLVEAGTQKTEQYLYEKSEDVLAYGKTHSFEDCSKGIEMAQKKKDDPNNGYVIADIIAEGVAAI